MAKIKVIKTWEDLPDILTTNVVAMFLSLTPETVRKECCRGNIKAFKVGDQWRIRKDDLIAYTMGVKNNNNIAPKKQP